MSKLPGQRAGALGVLRARCASRALVLVQDGFCDATCTCLLVLASHGIKTESCEPRILRPLPRLSRTRKPLFQR